MENGNVGPSWFSAPSAPIAEEHRIGAGLLRGLSQVVFIDLLILRNVFIARQCINPAALS
jgi:hypothetical protein